jgi:hypothetical protein
MTIVAGVGRAAATRSSVRTTRSPGNVTRLLSHLSGVAVSRGGSRGRGGGDVFASHDLEDIIAVVDGRAEIVRDVAAASSAVREYIAGEIYERLRRL